MVRVEPSKGGYKGKINVDEIITQSLAGGPKTMSELFRMYKDEVKNLYADEWALFEGGRRPTKTIDGMKHYIKKPPKGGTYLSFARYMNSLLNRGIIEKLQTDPGAHSSTLSPDLVGVLEAPRYYQLASAGAPKRERKPKRPAPEPPTQRRETVPVKREKQDYIAPGKKYGVCPKCSTRNLFLDIDEDGDEMFHCMACGFREYLRKG